MARILIVDDSAAVRGQIKAALGRDDEWDIIEAGDGLAALKIMMAEPPDLVVCDVYMPGVDGRKLLALRAARPQLWQIPIIMVTAESDPDRKVDVLKRGASDYVTKPWHPEELLARVRIHLRMKLLQDELREANKRLEALATTDGLSGLHNRRHFDRVLASETARADRFGTPLSLMMVDIDHFKSVNDTYGHPMGDEVIRNLGALFATSVRVTDVAARYGGEEIAVVLPNTTLEGAALLAERMREKFAATTHSLDKVTLRKTASFGVAEYARGTTPEDILRRADAALYQAKIGGRNRVMRWDQAPPTSGSGLKPSVWQLASLVDTKSIPAATGTDKNGQLHSACAFMSHPSGSPPFGSSDGTPERV